MAKVPPSRLPQTTTPRSKGVQAPLTGVTESVGGGNVRPNMPAAPVGPSFADLVTAFAQTITTGVNVMGDMNERERKAVVVAERNDIANIQANFDFDSVKPLPGEKNSAAMLRTLESMPAFTTLTKESQGIVYRELVGAFGRLQQQREAELMDRMAHEDSGNMGTRLANRMLVAQAIIDFPQHYENNKLQLTPKEIREPIANALRSYAAQGDTDGVKLLTKLAKDNGLPKEAAQAMKVAGAEKKRIAEEIKAAAEADAQKLELDFTNAIFDEIEEIEAAKLPASERQARYQALRDRTAKSQVFTESAKRYALKGKINSAYRREGEIDHSLIETFKQRIAAVHNGAKDPMLATEMYDAKTSGAFGPLGADSTNRSYNSMVTWLTNTKFAAKMKVASGIRAALKADLKAGRWYGDTQEWLQFGEKQMFLYEQEILMALEENPDWTDEQVLQHAMQKAAVYRDMKKSVIREEFAERVKKAEKEAKAPGSPPKEYPDAKWDAKRKMWTVIRDGRLMGVK